MPHVVLDIQHRGKPGSNDLGAGVDLDGDGKIETWEREAEHTPVYAGAALLTLAKAGSTGQLLLEGAYSARHAAANEIATERAKDMVAYVACHLNAGADYAAVFYDYRSSMGKTLAEMIAAIFANAYSGTSLPASLRVCKAIPARPDDWTRNAFATIQGIYTGPKNITAVCYEPCSVDVHRALLGTEAFALIGDALARGCIAWGSNAK